VRFTPNFYIDAINHLDTCCTHEPEALLIESYRHYSLTRPRRPVHTTNIGVRELLPLPPEALLVKRECTPSLFLLILPGYASHRRASDQRTWKCN